MIKRVGWLVAWLVGWTVLTAAGVAGADFVYVPGVAFESSYFCAGVSCTYTYTIVDPIAVVGEALVPAPDGGTFLVPGTIEHGTGQTATTILTFDSPPVFNEPIELLTVTGRDMGYPVGPPGGPDVLVPFTAVGPGGWSNPAPTPEPQTAVLLVVGLAGVVRWIRWGR